jgi:two-component system osmolarity sensor histidine kinase EnvZ
MLAGVAHDLRSPLTRLRLRADVLGDAAERDGFVQDIDAINHIVGQFLEYANESADPGPAVAVDAFLRTQFADGGVRDSAEPDADMQDGPLFDLQLAAGPDFVLPRTLLDRMVTNLVDNALEYGRPPILIATWRGCTTARSPRQCGPSCGWTRRAAAMATAGWGWPSLAGSRSALVAFASRAMLPMAGWKWWCACR